LRAALGRSWPLWPLLPRSPNPRRTLRRRCTA
jgi:hypothetical protein